MRQILYIAYTFPPMAYAGTFRTYRVCKNLPDFGISTTVITIKENPNAHNDYRLLDNIKNKVKIVRTATIDPWIKYQNLKNKKSDSKLFRFLKFIMGRIAIMCNKPDHMILWVPFAVLAGLKEMRKTNIDVIITTSPPFSTIITGFILKKLTGKKWIADMRDPIRDNMAVQYWDFITRKFNFLLEKLLVKYANHIITTTHYAANKLNERYNFNKATHVYNSFDEEDFQIQEIEKNGIFRLTHVGTLYWFRKSDALIEAIKMLRDDGVINDSNFKLEFIGMSDKNIIKQISNHQLENLVSIIPMVSHEKAVYYMLRADMLLLIKGIQHNSEAQIPSKLFEYMGTGNPILYLGPEKSEAADILKSAKNSFIVENDVRKIYEIIKHSIKNKSEKNLLVGKNIKSTSLYNEFNSKKMAENFVKIINSQTQDDNAGS